MSWPFVTTFNLEAMHPTQMRMLVTALDVKCDRIDQMSPGMSRDKQLAEVTDWVTAKWSDDLEARWRQANASADQRKEAA